MTSFKTTTAFFLALTFPTVVSAQSLLALGDSLCAGALPPLDGNPRTFFSDVGYTELLYEYIMASDDINNSTTAASSFTELCCYGEDTHEFLNGSYAEFVSDGSLCYPTSVVEPTTTNVTLDFDSQQDATETYLALSLQPLDVITLSLGANDVIGCIFAAEQQPLFDVEACLMQRIPALYNNTLEVLDTLVAYTTTSGADIPILALIPYNPFIAFDIVGDPTNISATVQQVSDVVNAQLIAIYENYGVLVVDSREAFAASRSDSDNIFDNKNNDDSTSLPTAVTNMCLYTGMCFYNDTSGMYELEPPETLDIHPNELGYQVLAQAHIDVLEAYWDVSNSDSEENVTDVPPSTTLAPTTADAPVPTEAPTMDDSGGCMRSTGAAILAMAVSFLLM